MVEDARLTGAVGRVRSSLFGAHVDAFLTSHEELGYRPSTIEQKLEGLADLSRWMVERQLALGDLDEQRIGEFINALRGSGRNWRGVRPALLLLLDQLRLTCVVPDVEAVRDESPGAAVLSRYEGYLRRERGEVERLATLESLRLPDTLDYRNVPGLSLELRDKLARLLPASIGHARRIPGMTPAAPTRMTLLVRSPAG